MMKPATLIMSLCFLIGEPMASSCFAQGKEDKRVKQLEDENRKLNRTSNPANRAKSLMRIGEITLSYVTDAANAEDFTKMRSYVEQYQKAVTDARDAMISSGLDPYKKSGGYKTVETTLRKQLRAAIANGGGA